MNMTSHLASFWMVLTMVLRRPSLPAWDFYRVPCWCQHDHHLHPLQESHTVDLALNLKAKGNRSLHMVWSNSTQESGSHFNSQECNILYVPYNQKTSQKRDYTNPSGQSLVNPIVILCTFDWPQFTIYIYYRVPRNREFYFAPAETTDYCCASKN